MRCREIGFIAVLPLVIVQCALGSAAALRNADFNGDGFGDLAIGVSNEAVAGHPYAGAVNVIYGSASGLVAQGNQLWHQDVAGIQGATGDYNEFGYALVFGDFDGDGHDDLAIGAPSDDIGSVIGAGVVHVLYGSNSGLTAAGNQLWHHDVAGVEGSAEQIAYFGAALAAGDFDGDGYKDLAIGAFNKTVGLIGRAGSVNILYGSANGLTATGDQLWSQNSSGILDQAESVTSPPSVGEFFGQELAAGDFDADGFDDLAIGVPREEITAGQPAQGAVHVIYGSAAGLSATGDQFWHQDSPGVVGAASAGNYFSRSLAAGDFDHDGFDDLAIGDHNDGWGHVTVLHGSASGLAGAGSQLWSQNSVGVMGTFDEDGFSSALAAGDFDGDGFDDLAIGAPHEAINGQPSAGVINVLFGSVNGLTASGDQYLHQDTTDVIGIAGEADWFGTALRTGDFDGDGWSDLAVGVPGEDIGQLHDGTGPFENAGAVNVMYGGASGLSAEADQLWTQHSPGIAGSGEEDDFFGWSL